MGTGLFDNLGVDIAALVDEHLSPGLLPAVLVMAAAAGSRTSGSLTAGPTAGTDSTYTGRGLVDDFEPRDFVNSVLLEAGDRRATLVIESFTPALSRDPKAGDTLEIEGHTYRVARLLSRDPAGATYTLQVRDM